MDARHTFTEPHTSADIELTDPDAPWYIGFSFARFEREWNDTAAQYAAKNDFFDRTMGAKRDADKAREWGISIDELPWNARKSS